MTTLRKAIQAAMDAMPYWQECEINLRFGVHEITDDGDVHICDTDDKTAQIDVRIPQFTRTYHTDADRAADAEAGAAAPATPPDSTDGIEPIEIAIEQTGGREDGGRDDAGAEPSA